MRFSEKFLQNSTEEMADDSSTESTESSLSSVESEDDHWTVKLLTSAGPQLLLLPIPCTLGLLRLHVHRRLALEAGLATLRLGGAPPHRIDGVDAMELESFGFKDWCTVTVQHCPAGTLSLGFVMELTAAKVSCDLLKCDSY